MFAQITRILGFLLVLGPAVFAAGNNWMTPLDGALPLSQFSIPGTHDSGARFEPFPGSAKCQNLTIGQQLDAGVRFLDIRCRHVDDGFIIHHGPIYQNLNFDDVLDATTGFLNANPGETVIMSVKEEHTPENNTRSFVQTFESYVAQNPAKWVLGTGIPTLDAARGKIVLFRRFGGLPNGIDASNWPDNTTFSTGGRLRVQDRYVVPDNNAKWDAITAILDEARYGGPNTLYVNFASGYRSGAFDIPSITTVSNNINLRLTTFFTNNPSGRFGALLMDFADAAKASLIYNTNDPAGRAVHHPAYFMIVNRNSGKAIDLISGNTSNGAQINQWTYDYGGQNQRWALAPTENAGHFRITSWVSGKCACIENDSTAAGAKLHAWDYTGGNLAQQFDLIDAGGGYYKLRNVNSNLVLEITGAGTANNVRVQQAVDTGSTNQQWRLQPWGDYFIRAGTGKYICIENRGFSNGNRIVQYSWENNPWFKWRFEGVTNGHLKASSLNALPRVLCVPDASTTAGVDCHLYDYQPANTGDQKLLLIPRTNGRFKFRFVHSDMVWDIPGGNTGNLVPLEQYPDNGNVWQEFQLERIVSPPAMVVPDVRLDLESGAATLTWPSQAGFNYLPRRSDTLAGWHDLVPGAMPGTGLTMGVVDDAGAVRSFYQVVITPGS